MPWVRAVRLGVLSACSKISSSSYTRAEAQASTIAYLICSSLSVRAFHFETCVPPFPASVFFRRRRTSESKETLTRDTSLSSFARRPTSMTFPTTSLSAARRLTSGPMCRPTLATARSLRKLTSAIGRERRRSRGIRMETSATSSAVVVVESCKVSTP